MGLGFEELALAWVSAIREDLEVREGKGLQAWASSACVSSEVRSVEENRVQGRPTFGCEGHGGVQERKHYGEADRQNRRRVA